MDTTLTGRSARVEPDFQNVPVRTEEGRKIHTAFTERGVAEAGERCRDFDQDCTDVRCKVSCWLYAPELGLCPFLTGELPCA